jgi:hypothetical protein
VIAGAIVMGTATAASAATSTSSPEAFDAHVLGRVGFWTGRGTATPATRRGPALTTACLEVSFAISGSRKVGSTNQGRPWRLRARY